ncbi:MAG TPA: RidA family protein [Phycisphaerae bacterium]|nr:RidA family protein [Phycisphaerae bacterium]
MSQASAEQRLQQLGLALPAVAKPVGAYRPAVLTGNWVFVSGQLPIAQGRLLCEGKVGAEVDLADASRAARQAALNALAAAAAEAGGLDRITQIVHLRVFVNSAAGFVDQAGVANGASELLAHVFGSAGQHARVAVGVAELPLNAPVELELVVEVQRDRCDQVR